MLVAPEGVLIVASLVVFVPFGKGVRYLESVFYGEENIDSFFKLRVISATVLSRSFFSPELGRGVSEVPDVGFVGTGRRFKGAVEKF